MRTAIIFFVIFFCMPALAFSAILKVPSQYPTIQDAIDAASGGDTVLVAPGTYVENIDFTGKAITVTSEQGVDVTIIDGNQAGSVVRCGSGEGLDSVLDGFIITNGSGTYDPGEKGYFGGGICNNSSSPTVTNCIFSGNGAGGGGIMGFGGGMCNYSSSPTVTNCTFSSNSADFGGFFGSGGNGGGMCNLTSSPYIGPATSYD
jgi:hypothetical protein